MSLIDETLEPQTKSPTKVLSGLEKEAKLRNSVMEPGDAPQTKAVATKVMDTQVESDGAPAEASEWPAEVNIPAPGMYINGQHWIGKRILTKDEFAYIRWQLTYKVKHDLFVTRDPGPGVQEHGVILNGGGR